MLLPYARQDVSDEDVAIVAKALRADILTGGEQVEGYEADLQAYTGAAHVVSCNSCTAALHLALLALKLGPGDVVVIPSVTFLATANAVKMTGAHVVFADVDADTGLLTPAQLKEALLRASSQGRVRAAIAVHLNGQLCDTQGLAQILARQDAVLIEDAAHALGAKYKWGSEASSVMACFSTHPVKAIATGEGGFVTTNDAHLAHRLRLLRSHGMLRNPSDFVLKDIAFTDGVPNEWHYEMREVGWNYRIPDILCALGRAQLRRLDGFVARRQQLAQRYLLELTGTIPHVMPVPRGMRPDGLHLFPILIDFAALGTTRRQVMVELREVGIGSQVHYIPVHLQPYYASASTTPILSGALRYFERCLSIPLFPALKDDEQALVVASLRRVLTKG